MNARTETFYRDIRASFRLAMYAEHVPNGAVERILDVVDDYIVNHHGEDDPACAECLDGSVVCGTCDACDVAHCLTCAPCGGDE
jgi:hypothetical protein